VVLASGVSRAETQHRRQNWFPPPQPMRAAYDVPAEITPAPDQRDQAIAPLPPAAWSGLTGLATLGLVGCRKAFKRFLIG
jgi:hypothetical protein